MAEPYSDSWLRERGASFDPLTGMRVPPLPKEKTQEKTPPGTVEIAQPESSGPEAPASVGAAIGIPEAITESAPSPAQVPHEVSVIKQGGEAPAPASDEYQPVRKKSSRLPIIIGILLAVAAVVAAEHYLVPIFTHSKPKEVPSANSPQSSQVSPSVKSSPRPFSKPSTQAPISAPQPAVVPVHPSPAPTPRTTVQPSVPPVQRTEAPMPRAEPTVPRSTPSATPQIQRPVSPSQPAAVPSPQERVSKAQYEQKHMQQLLSPLS